MALPAIVPNGEVPPDVSHGGKLALVSMTVDQAERAARAAGMITLKIRKVKATSLVGDYLTQIGVLSYGRALLAFTSEQAKLTMERCQKLMSKKGVSAETQLSLMQMNAELIDKLNKSADSIVKSASVDASRGANENPPNKSFHPMQPVVPIMAAKVDVHVGEGHLVCEKAS